jgi:sulfotransferase family protein
MKTELLEIEKNAVSRDAANSGPLFVVGMWRSGTSLLYTMLNQHPRISLMYEGDLPLLWPLFLGGASKSDWMERWEFWNGAPTRHELRREKFPTHVASLHEATEMAYRERSGDAIWGCKSPNYYDAMEQLGRDFPTARFIVIYRNPADICRSIIRAGLKESWFARSGMTLRALLGYSEMKKAADNLAAAGMRVHVLQYEELVSEPETVLRRICEFLEIPFDPGMVSLENVERSPIYEADHHGNLKAKKIRARKSAAEEEVLPPAFRKKIARYTNLWREKYDGAWPAYGEPDDVDASNPGWLERFSDSLQYRWFRILDDMVMLIYCFIPLGLLRRYRDIKGHPKMSSMGSTLRRQEQTKTGAD